MKGFTELESVINELEAERQKLLKDNASLRKEHDELAAALAHTQNSDNWKCVKDSTHKVFFPFTKGRVTYKEVLAAHDAALVKPLEEKYEKLRQRNTEIMAGIELVLALDQVDDGTGDSFLRGLAQGHSDAIEILNDALAAHRQNAELTAHRDMLLGQEPAVHLGAQVAVSAILQMEGLKRERDELAAAFEKANIIVSEISKLEFAAQQSENPARVHRAKIRALWKEFDSLKENASSILAAHDAEVIRAFVDKWKGVCEGCGHGLIDIGVVNGFDNHAFTAGSAESKLPVCAHCSEADNAIQKTEEKP